MEYWKTDLPNKGDLLLPKNYRGIMLLEIAYKIIATILYARLLPIEESLNQESQCGLDQEEDVQMPFLQSNWL